MSAEVRPRWQATCTRASCGRDGGGPRWQASCGGESGRAAVSESGGDLLSLCPLQAATSSLSLLCPRLGPRRRADSGEVDARTVSCLGRGRRAAASWLGGSGRRRAGRCCGGAGANYFGRCAKGSATSAGDLLFLRDEILLCAFFKWDADAEPSGDGLIV
jgi:hypothetical protein